MLLKVKVLSFLSPLQSRVSEFCSLQCSTVQSLYSFMQYFIRAKHPHVLDQNTFRPIPQSTFLYLSLSPSLFVLHPFILLWNPLPHTHTHKRVRISFYSNDLFIIDNFTLMGAILRTYIIEMRCLDVIKSAFIISAQSSFVKY